MDAVDTFLDPTRASFREGLTTPAIQSLVEAKRLRVLQTSEPIPNRLWRSLNDTFFAARPDVELRIFGFYRQKADLSFLQQMGNVRRFSADCIQDATGLEHLASLSRLESLGLGVRALQSFDILDRLPRSLTDVSLHATKSKRPSLHHLSRFDRLERLFIEGHSRGIDAISSLSDLRDITLRSVSFDGLEFLRPLRHLWSLDIKLGGITDLSAISGMGGIKYLELWQIKGLQDISVMSSLTGLQHLFLQSLPHITELPDVSRLTNLRRVHLDNMKGLTNLNSLADAPAMEELWVAASSGNRFGRYVDVLRNQALKRVSIGFGSIKRNAEFDSRARRAGKSKFDHKEFKYR